MTDLTIPLTLAEVQKRVKCPNDGCVAVRGDVTISTDRHELLKQLLASMQREAFLEEFFVRIIKTAPFHSCEW